MAKHGQTETLKLVIERGADVNAKDYKERTHADWAAKYGQTETLKLLIEHGANFSPYDVTDRTPRTAAETLEATSEKGCAAG